ncbi:hypothetical protein OEZ86_000187 [Tetradesmus obliquus]|nr:hypothetical protein OEZ86_000187 [Tetradesmus obliquus]
MLQVPSLEVGQLLIRSLYQAQPQLQQCSQPQLLQLIMLADRFDATKAVAAASKQLQRIAAQGRLEWATACLIMRLPPACPEMAAYKPLFQAAAALIQEELGDLEVACADQQAKWPKLGIESLWFTTRLTLCKASCPHADVFEIGSFKSYAECERQLRAKGLVQPDATLKMQLLVQDVR